MDLLPSITRVCRVAAFMLMIIMMTSVAGYGQPSVPPRNIQNFFHEITGEWIGTVEQYTGGIKADTKYFHAFVKQTSPDTYAAEFEYYRIDKDLHAPVKVGATSMTNKIISGETATNTIIGKGDVFIKPGDSKPEEHQLSEVLRMSPTGSLEGKGSGRISVSGITLGAGKNGKVSDYTSTWVLNNGVLSINERLKVTFKVLFFAKHFDIIDSFEAKRGSDIVGLMKSVQSNLTPSPASTSTNH